MGEGKRGEEVDHLSPIDSDFFKFDKIVAVLVYS